MGAIIEVSGINVSKEVTEGHAKLIKNTTCMDINGRNKLSKSPINILQSSNNVTKTYENNPWILIEGRNKTTNTSNEDIKRSHEHIIIEDKHETTTETSFETIPNIDDNSKHNTHWFYF